MSKGMIAALLLSFVIALSLALLPEHAFERENGHLNLMGGAGDGPVLPVASKAGMIDHLGQLNLQSRLHQVVWQADQLTVWLAVPTRKLAEGRPYDDIYKIAHRFLMGAAAYQQIEVRVVDAAHPNEVLFAVIAEQRDMAAAPDPNTASGQAFVQQHFHVVENSKP